MNEKFPAGAVYKLSYIDAVKEAKKSLELAKEAHLEKIVVKEARVVKKAQVVKEAQIKNVEDWSTTNAND